MAHINYKRTPIAAQGDLRLFLNTELAKIETALQQVFALAGDIDMLLGAQVGEFIPVLIGGTTPGTAAYTTQLGRYVKVGRGVLFTLELQYTGHTGTGEGRISNLPFAPAAGMSGGALITPSSGYPGGTLGYADVATGMVLLRTSAFVVQNIVAAGGLLVSGFYFTNS